MNVPEGSRRGAVHGLGNERGEHGSAQLEQQWRTIEIRAERGAGTAARDDQKIQRELLDIQSVMI
ncbi:MAG TPA: hypothetical protein VI072_02315, partial [Polyangiaceae bacterium]